MTDKVWMASVSWYRKGESPEDWRNRRGPIGTHLAVGTVEQEPTLDGLVNVLLQRVTSNHGRQYAAVQVEIAQLCPTCYGRHRVPTARNRFVTKLCPDCKGKD